MGRRINRTGGGRSNSSLNRSSSSSNQKYTTKTMRSSTIARRRANAKSKQRLRSNCVTTAEANKRWKQFPNELTSEDRTPCSTSTSPVIIKSIPRASPRILNVPKTKYIKRETDTLVRLKQNIKDRILIKNASSTQRRDYFSFAKAFREIDLNSDGALDREEFEYACGEKRLNLGLSTNDVKKLFREFSQEGEEIGIKQFLKGMADLDKPDLDLVSVLTEYKGRALTALIDRLNDSDLPLSPGGPTTSFLSTSRSNQHNEQLLSPASISLPNLTDESMHDNIQENEIEKDFPSSGHLLPTPQLQLKKNYNTASNYSRSSSNLLSYKSRQILGDSRQSILKKLPPLSPVHRVWGNDEGYSSSSLEKSKSVSYLKSLQANSLESKAVQAAARDCQAGYFTAARFCKNPPWKSISCGIFPKLPEISPIRQRRNTRMQVDTAGNTAWHKDSERAKQLHLERTEGSSIITKKRTDGYILERQKQQATNDDLYWSREKNRVLGKTAVRASYMTNVFAQQEVELDKSSKTCPQRSQTRSIYAMRTKMGSGDLW